MRSHFLEVLPAHTHSAIGKEVRDSQAVDEDDVSVPTDEANDSFEHSQLLVELDTVVWGFSTGGENTRGLCSRLECSLSKSVAPVLDGDFNDSLFARCHLPYLHTQLQSESGEGVEFVEHGCRSVGI